MRRIGNEVTEYSGTRSRCQDSRCTEGLIDGLRKVNPIVLVAAEKESLVLFNWTTNFKARLEHPD
jgi:hypothetical protein